VAVLETAVKGTRVHLAPLGKAAPRALLLQIKHLGCRNGCHDLDDGTHSTTSSALSAIWVDWSAKAMPRCGSASGVCEDKKGERAHPCTLGENRDFQVTAANQTLLGCRNGCHDLDDGTPSALPAIWAGVAYLVAEAQLPFGQYLVVCEKPRPDLRTLPHRGWVLTGARAIPAMRHP
jgi:hypothetical protein